MKTKKEEANYSKELVILRGEEVRRTRGLWEEVFSTDSQEFIDYYYETKAVYNICFVIQDNEQIAAMVHLTPYDICVKANAHEKGHVIYPTYYIVGVATRQQDRHKGYMTRLLEAAFAYMRKEKVLFTFLMPASPAIYEPFDFHYIYERTEYQMMREEELPITKEAVRVQSDGKELSIRYAVEKDCKELADFAQKMLEETYTFFLKRTEEYFRILLSELASENGRIYMVFMDGKLCGYFMYAKEEKGYVQEVLCKEVVEEILFDEKDPFLIKCPTKKPIIMAKYLGTNGQEDSLLKKLAFGKTAHGFINEIV